LAMSQRNCHPRLERARGPCFWKFRTELRLGRESVVCFRQFSVNRRYLFLCRILG
jgi:hypothetical protein